jgi:hypothetical protein
VLFVYLGPEVLDNERVEDDGEIVATSEFVDELLEADCVEFKVPEIVGMFIEDVMDEVPLAVGQSADARESDVVATTELFDA